MLGTLGPATREECAARDALDPLAALRDLFDLPEGVAYLDGNSLGPPSRASRARVLHLIDDEWGRGLIGSWLAAGWVETPVRLGERIGRLIGARPGEVVVTDSTSVNLFKLLAAALALRPGRRVIVQRRGDFPTDAYIAEGLADLVGATRRVVDGADLADSIDADVAVVCATHVDYRTGALLDMAGLTAAAHQAGALALWDLAHSAGAVPLDISGCDVDLAVGCGYKFLNGGPGAPAFAMAATRHHAGLRQPLAGWFGHADPFAFAPGYAPAPDARRLLCGTPPMLAMAALDGALDAFDQVDMTALRTRSLELSGLLIDLVDARCSGAIEVVTPRDEAVRGSQVSLRHRQADRIVRDLAAHGVLGDYRPPDIVRLGIAPLYLRRVDVWDCVEALTAVLAAAG